MKVLKYSFVAFALALAGCGDSGDAVKVSGHKITAMGDNSPISGGASYGSYSSNLFGSSGQFRSYLNSDIARVPIKLEIQFSDFRGKPRGSKTYMYDVFLQKAEVIDIINNKSLKNFRMVYTTQINSYYMGGGVAESEVCYNLLYNDRQVEIQEPGTTAQWCQTFRQ